MEPACHGEPPQEEREPDLQTKELREVDLTWVPGKERGGRHQEPVQGHQECRIGFPDSVPGRGSRGGYCHFTCLQEMSLEGGWRLLRAAAESEASQVSIANL